MTTPTRNSQHKCLLAIPTAARYATGPIVRIVILLPSTYYRGMSSRVVSFRYSHLLLPWLLYTVTTLTIAMAKANVEVHLVVDRFLLNFDLLYLSTVINL